ncbi:response regulator of citrate/malate metabolism [Arthrobacter pigmenti]|uniref:Transcriptional regulatory protein n=1 Tax=Arthrobacter pigmenti TaxID=271432 RepID=A0A846RUT1_9MICC|nr:response regulator [Arthrobacter pigmenti]NJC22031.1 response regulator of citrate/malate metabolism [Arthrobacter pigmenti]
MVENAGELPIRVLVVEDDPIAAEAHALYVQRLNGFELAGTAGTGSEALAMLRRGREPGAGVVGGIDLVLLDMNLPDLHGLDIIRRIRGSGSAVDVIAITAVRDLAVVRSAISSGIVQYLIKPFTYSAFSEKLGNYRQFRDSLHAQASSTTQSEVDNALAALRPPSQGSLPKGLSDETLRAVVSFLSSAKEPVSAVEVASSLELSRVTARRYLEYLADSGSARRMPRYGTRGRPELEYTWSR